MCYGNLSHADEIKKQTFVLTSCSGEEWASLSASFFLFLVPEDTFLD